MTKRFTGEFDKQYSGVHDNGEQLTNFEVVDLLNTLSEDNEYLEKRFKEEEWHYNHIDEDRDVWKHKCQELEKENEQLKQFQDRVFSWIDMHLQRLPTLIDDEFNSDNEFADPSLYSGALQILETMKKELKGDVK